MGDNVGMCWIGCSWDDGWIVIARGVGSVNWGVVAIVVSALLLLLMLVVVVPATTPALVGVD